MVDVRAEAEPPEEERGEGHGNEPRSRKIAGDCVRIPTSIVDPTIVGWNCKPLNRRAARSGGSGVNPCCFMKFVTADRAMFVSLY